jgi:hypothetical protein
MIGSSDKLNCQPVARRELRAIDDVAFDRDARAARFAAQHIGRCESHAPAVPAAPERLLRTFQKIHPIYIPLSSGR